MNPILLQRAQEKIDELMAKIKNSSYGSLWSSHLVSRGPLKVAWDLKGRVAGYAHYYEWKIRLNYELYEQNEEDFLNRTIGHEIAHLLTYLVFGTSIKPHGLEWRKMDRFLGGDGSRCHSYDTSQVSTVQNRRTFEYKCQCRRHDIKLNKHRKMQNGAKYVCVRCRQPLVFTGFELVG